MKAGTACVTKKGVERWKNGHPWIYAADVESVGSDVQGGDVVRVEDSRGWFMGQALYSKASKISLRWLAWDDTPIDVDLFRARLEAADALRRKEYPDDTAYRVVHGEADLIPGLVVDRFGDYLSVQFLHAGTERRKQLFVDLLPRTCRGFGVGRHQVAPPQQRGGAGLVAGLEHHQTLVAQLAGRQ